MKYRAWLATSAALGLLAAVPLAAADAAAEYRNWNRVVQTLTDAGYTAVEEIESRLFGGFEVEAVHSDGQEYQLTMDSDGKLSSRQLRGPKHASADLIDLQILPRVLAWLEAQKYADLDQIAGDDGLVEIEARNADGRDQELELDPLTLKLVAVERG